MKLIVNNKDISQFYTSAKWNGEVGSAARTLDFEVVVSGTDKNLPRVSIMAGDEVQFYNNEGKLLFLGNVYSKEKSVQSNTMSVNCLDKLVVANSTKDSFNFSKKTPKQIAEEAFKKIGLEIGKAEDGSPLDRIFDVENLYNIVLIAYKLENEKSGKPFLIRMNEDKVDIVEKGKVVAKYQLDGKSNLLDAKYSESSENAISTVKMYDENGKEIGEVKNDVKGGGTEIYRKEKDEDPNARAKGMLKGLERSASVTVLGNYELITGNAVIVKEPFTGLEGKFYIDADSHIFENNKHITELTLKYENVMQDIDTSVKEEKAESSESKGSITNLGGGNLASKVLGIGESLKGTRYLWGGNTAKGIDCSGFVDYCYSQAGADIPGRLTSAELRNNPKQFGFYEIPFKDRRPGDVLWQSGHVAMQYSSDKIIESGGVSKRIMGYSGVCISSSKGRTFSKAYRRIGT